MKIYLVTRTDKVDWDEYAAWVVKARDKKEALELCNWSVGSRVKPNAIIEEIKLEGEPKAILGDYHAG